MPSNNINAIAIDTDGNKWFGTIAGVSVFKNDKWTHHTNAHSSPLLFSPR
ncbi:MAG TPA: hypothetical protein DCX46_05475 [Bacteroidetes bacterium]|nr:hypothetical protein [Bacteroidota bacterium]